MFESLHELSQDLKAGGRAFISHGCSYEPSYWKDTETVVRELEKGGKAGNRALEKALQRLDDDEDKSIYLLWPALYDWLREDKYPEMTIPLLKALAVRRERTYFYPPSRPEALDLAAQTTDETVEIFLIDVVRPEYDDEERGQTVEKLIEVFPEITPGKNQAYLGWTLKEWISRIGREAVEDIDEKLVELLDETTPSLLAQMMVASCCALHSSDPEVETIAGTALIEGWLRSDEAHREWSRGIEGIWPVSQLFSSEVENSEPSLWRNLATLYLDYIGQVRWTKILPEVLNATRKQGGPEHLELALEITFWGEEWPQEWGANDFRDEQKETLDEMYDFWAKADKETAPIWKKYGLPTTRAGWRAYTDRTKDRPRQIPEWRELYEVPWSELNHAYGAAVDVPRYLRGVLHPDKKRREAVFWGLYGNIYHQGTRYSATVPTIPFLREIFEYPDLPARPEVLHYLTSLAVGWPEELEKEPFSPDELFGKTSDYDPENHGRRCWEKIGENVEQYLALLGDDDFQVQAEAAYLLAWYPQHRGKTTPIFLEMMKDDRRPDEVREAALYAISLCHPESHEEYDGLLKAWRDQGREPETIPYLSAAALAVLAMREKDRDEWEDDLLLWQSKKVEPPQGKQRVDEDGETRSWSPWANSFFRLRDAVKLVSPEKLMGHYSKLLDEVRTEDEADNQAHALFTAFFEFPYGGSSTSEPPDEPEFWDSDEWTEIQRRALRLMVDCDLLWKKASAEATVGWSCGCKVQEWMKMYLRLSYFPPRKWMADELDRLEREDQTDSEGSPSERP